MVGILLSYWDDLFSGAMLVSGSVAIDHYDQFQRNIPVIIGFSWVEIILLKHQPYPIRILRITGMSIVLSGFFHPYK